MYDFELDVNKNKYFLSFYNEYGKHILELNKTDLLDLRDLINDFLK